MLSWMLPARPRTHGDQIAFANVASLEDVVSLPVVRPRHRRLGEVRAALAFAPIQECTFGGFGQKSEPVDPRV
jgi:hypothetical protein